MSLPNRYFICLSYLREPIPWDLEDEEQRNAPVYYREVLREVEQKLPDRGLTIYLTWKLDLLPSYGESVVALVMGDEWSRVPRYSQKVLATFKLYGTAPYLGINHWLPLSRIKMMLGLKYVRSRLLRLPGALRRMLVSANHRLLGIPQSPIIPGNQTNLCIHHRFRILLHAQDFIFITCPVVHIVQCERRRCCDPDLDFGTCRTDSIECLQHRLSR